MFLAPAELTVADLSSAIVPDPLIVAPTTSVMKTITQMSGIRAMCSSTLENEEAAALFLEARSSCALVVEGGQLLGILTERDVVRLSAQEQSLEHLPIGKVMAHPVITLNQSAFTDLFFAVNLLQQYHIRHLPLLDDQGGVVGLLTHESLRQMSRPIDLLKMRLVSEVMTPRVICAAPGESMLAITRLMAEHQVSSVVLVEGRVGLPGSLKIPIGIVTERDIVQFQALELNFERLLAQDVMSRPVFSVRPEDSLWTVQQMMQQYLVRRVLVTGSQGELLGIVTQTSLLKVLSPVELSHLVGALEHKVNRLEAERCELLKDRNIELERQVQERTAILAVKAQREQLMATLASQIHSSLDLPSILDRAIQGVQLLLGCDCAAIWQLQPGGVLAVVAEALAIGGFSFVGEQSWDACLLPDWLESDSGGQVRVVADIDTVELSNCHCDLLNRLPVRAKVLVPILQGATFWGLMGVFESQAPRQWQREEVALLQQLSTQLAIAIQQATAYRQLQTELVERRRIEADLRQSEQRYASLAAAAPVGIFQTDVEGGYLYVSERWCSMTGLTFAEALGLGWLRGVHGEDQNRVLAEWFVAAREKRPFQLEYRFQKPDRSITWVFGQAVAERDTHDRITGYVGTITDISDRKQAEDLLLYNALHDTLTHLPNRNLLMQRLEQAIDPTQPPPAYQFAVLFLDLDRFKLINDSLGHLAGDQLLTLIAQKLKATLRTSDLAARLGGDEFVILLESCEGVEAAALAAERILAEFQNPVVLNGVEVFMTASIGIVVGHPGYTQASHLLRDSDIAMYRAKAQGKSCYKVFDAEMHTQILKRVILENDFRKALEREEFRVYYQPIIDLHQNRLVGFEALARWYHPMHQWIAPAEFVTIAEETGLIVPLDSWVLARACQQLVAWQAQYPHQGQLRVSVNLSAQDLCKATLAQDVQHTLAETGLAAPCLTLEITESMLIENIADTITTLEQLKALGVQISIDDFGTGYSSLSYLHRLPVNTLKIDRSFVNQMQPGSRNYRVVETIIALSDQLSLAVVAEGIETAEQLQWLKSLGCELGQGYWFAKPLPAHEVEAQLLDPLENA